MTHLTTRFASLILALLVGASPLYAANSTTAVGRTATNDDTVGGAPIGPPFLNAKDFGVMGDGVTNDAPAIRALLTSSRMVKGGRVHFPAGTYLIWRGEVEPDNIVFDGTTISGDGPATLFVGRDETGLVPDDRGAPRWNIFQASSRTGVTIQDVSFTGYLALLNCYKCILVTVKHVHGNGLLPNADANMLNMGVHFGFCQDVKVLDSTWTNFNDAVYFAGDVTLATRGAIVSGNDFEHTVAAGAYETLFPVGVYVFHSDYIVITHNTFRNIYSSLDNGGTDTGMGYGVYIGDGTNLGTVVAENDFLYTGNGGTKNATAIAFGGDTVVNVTGNNIRSIAGRLFWGILGRSDFNNSTRIIADNVLSMSDDTGFTDPVTECCRPFAIMLSNGLSGFATNVDYWIISNNLIKGPWENGIKITAEPKSIFNVIDNEIIGSVLSQIRIDGYTTNFNHMRLAGNRLLNGQLQGIEFWEGTVRAIIENNTIVDGNLSNAAGNEGMAILFRTPVAATAGNDGSIIRNNTIINTPNGGGLFTGAAAQEVALTSRIFKDVVVGNILTGLNKGAAAWVNFPTASPTTGFYDADFGDVIYNTALDAGDSPGWVCTKASLTPLTVSASNASTTITVADTAGYVAGDLILLSKTNNPYLADHGDATKWHATTIASVTNGTEFVITDAIPVGDGTYVSGTGMVKRAVFKPLAVIGS